MDINEIERQIDDANLIYKKGVECLKQDDYDNAIEYLTDSRDAYEDIYNSIDKTNAEFGKILNTLDEIIDECDEMIEECKNYVAYKGESFVDNVKDFFDRDLTL